jgi:gliding motility-associated-like protein
MAIADVADALYDSAVFFEESSFDAGGSVVTSVLYPNNGIVGYEGCTSTYLRFVRELGDPDLTIAIPLSTTGTATSGVDYTPLPDTVFLFGGTDTLLVPINILTDNITEGLETIVFNIPNACKCSEQTITVSIEDQTPLLGTLSGGKICFGETFTLEPSVSGGIAPLTYTWSTGSTDQNLTVGAVGTYTVSVSDFCGQVLELSTFLDVTLPINLTISQELVSSTDTFELKATTTIPPGLIASAGWSPGNHLSCATCATTLAWPPLTTTYTYTLLTTDGCAATASALLTGKGQLNVYVPNVFSPNYDNINDKFWIFGRVEDIRAVRRFAVFDRWGNKVFENGRSQVNDVASGWDGTFRGREQNPAVFGWFAEIEAYNGEIFLYDGDVTLTR